MKKILGDLPPVVLNLSLIFILVMLGLGIRTGEAQAGGVFFVKPLAVGTGNCSSWVNACNLMTALATVEPGDEIWVAAGVYYPGSGRDDSFSMESGIAAYGGFSGTETLRSERNWKTNLTVLSGDVDQNDTKDANGIVTNVSGITGQNAYHVLVGFGVDQTAIIDGFIINAGQADTDDSYHNQGGGVYLYQGSPTLNNLIISANLAKQGAGLMNEGGNASITNTAFLGNFVTGNYNSGGGMYNSNGNPSLSNVLFGGNYAYYGGGFYSINGSPTLVNATFSGNNNYQYDGTVQIVGSGTTTLTNVIIWGNQSAIAVGSGSTVNVTYSIVEGNYVGASNLNIDPFFDDPQHYSLAPTTAGDYHPRYGSVSTDLGSNTAITTPLDLDGNPRVADGDGDSIAHVDLGAYEQLPGTCGPGGVLFVDQDASGTDSGLSWEDAFTDLQTALVSARMCQVWVAEGVYYPAADASDRSQAFLLRNFVKVYGGFSGSETLLSERDWPSHPTVLSGDLDRNDIKNTDGIVTNVEDIEGTNAYHVVMGIGVDHTAGFDGFIINAGQADGTTFYHNQGGGVYVSQGNPTFNNLNISANSSNSQGAGLVNDRSNTTITNTAFQGNYVPGSYNSGGGMFNSNGNPLLTNVLFSGNYAYYGSGFYSVNGSPTLVNATFSGNNNDLNEGAIYLLNGTTTLTNAIIWGNRSTIGGGGATVNMTYSIIQGGYSGEGNLNEDPLFKNPQLYSLSPTTAGDYGLLYGSPAIDSGNNAPVTTLVDLAGKPRLADGDCDDLNEVDRGAYEWSAYRLTIHLVGNGNVNRSPDQCAYDSDETISLTAIPDLHWAFAGWSGDVISQENPLQWILTGNTTITATFTEVFSIYLPLIQR